MSYFAFFYADGDMNNNKKKNRKSFHIKYNHSQGMQTTTRNRKKTFSKALSMTFKKFEFCGYQY